MTDALDRMSTAHWLPYAMLHYCIAHYVHLQCSFIAYKRKATKLCLGLQIVGCPFSIHLINMSLALSAPNVTTKHYKNVHFFIPHLVFYFVLQLPFPEFFSKARKIPNFILCDALRHHFKVNRSECSTVQPRQILATPTLRVSSMDWYLSIATLYARIRPEIREQAHTKAPVWIKYRLNFIYVEKKTKILSTDLLFFCARDYAAEVGNMGSCGGG